MSSALTCPGLLSSTLDPFLYPCIDCFKRSTSSIRRAGRYRSSTVRRVSKRWQTSTTNAYTNRTLLDPLEKKPPVDVSQYDYLNPQPREFSDTPFLDSCNLSVHSGSGGHGCISFLREKYVANGPPNGGDGGTGGGIYIQAVRGETSLHKLARRGIVKAGRGKNGQGSLKGGSRGEDILLTVPVGTVVREIFRRDPIAEELELQQEERRLQRRREGFGRDLDEDAGKSETSAPDQTSRWRRDRWLLYPGALPSSFTSADFPALPRPRRSNIATMQPAAPLQLDLDKPMSTPLLLAAGAMGGLGNPHFVTKSIPRPKFATKGDDGVSLHLQLELKLLADVGLVGLPNAGKSTLLRALTSSRARIGEWAFTTLTPNIGTVVLDDHKGRPAFDAQGRRKDPRTNFTIADIPGLIENAHQDRGLGLGFLRHIERAAVLCFVVDLSAGDAVLALQGLWHEVQEYEALREHEINAESERTTGNVEGVVPISTGPVFENGASELERASRRENGHDEANLLDRQVDRVLPQLILPPISSKPWFVVATKADLSETQNNFMALQDYLAKVECGAEPHPTTKKNAWRKRLQALPVSAMRKEGVEQIPGVVLSLLDD